MLVCVLSRGCGVQFLALTRRNYTQYWRNVPCACWLPCVELPSSLGLLTEHVCRQRDALCLWGVHRTVSLAHALWRVVCALLLPCGQQQTCCGAVQP